MFRAFSNPFGFFNYFSTPSSPEQLPKMDFAYKSKDHLQILEQRLKCFKQAQQNLFEFDNQILTSLGVGLFFYAGSSFIPLLPSTTLSIAGFSYAAYLWGHRSANPDLVLRPYWAALKDLIEAYSWAMTKKDKWYKLGVPLIQEVILTLGPFVKPETIALWSEEDFSSYLLSYREIEPSETFKEKCAEFSAGRQVKNIWFGVYGEGGNGDLMAVSIAYLKGCTQRVAERYAPAMVTGYLKMQ
ncbi:hypothetical protein [Legionella jordanis]|uniref:Uncharacterized protein n=1 Tax=Legionella jordanis TaxID=456 RepID=A0A0W0VCG5_9GAMM|nr:hypothetical protein [Legionella jordanis]KTD17828.1 hypothetical protein Ljor_2134 [Legionella jordanis]RMX02471.1 hypothetical protein EAW55_09495 [Legionella jordanis]RMX21686.1 hypothetical protein EAS68_02725 [Legionella jordanis]VEH11235.1 Uncharacterised protein [Legionella jordanis]HAT8713797.1 hypothetical protein [Legionella jordanis]